MARRYRVLGDSVSRGWGRFLAARGVAPERVVRLHERGLKKRRHVDFDEEHRDAVFREVLAELAPLLIAADPEVEPRIRAVLGA